MAARRSLRSLLNHRHPTFDTGVSIAASEARGLARNAGLVPAVLDGRSEVLDLGRSRRPALRAPASRAVFTGAPMTAKR